MRARLPGFRVLSMINGILQDVRYALRGMRRSPGFAVVCIATLALGIGANTAIFAAMNGVLLRPVPGVANPRELVTLKRLQKNNPDYGFGYPDYLDYVKQNQSFAGLAGHCRTRLTLTHDHGATELAIGELVSGNYFSVLGIQPAVGRLIAPSDVQTEGDSAVAVLSYGIWQRELGADRDVVGKTIQLNGGSFVVVGVAAKDFSGSVMGSPTDVWVPFTMQPVAIPRMSKGILASRNAGWVGIFGRPKPGMRLTEARSELQTIAARLAEAYPESNEHRSVDVVPSFGMDPDDRGTLERFFALLLASVGLLLLIASSNVANLLLSRSEGRRREIAMRLALGAGRGRLIRQLLTEGVLMAVLGGGLGLLLAPWMASLMLAFRQPLYAMRNVQTGVDVRVVGFTALVAGLTGILFALAPALQASRPDLVVALKENTSGGGRRSRLRDVLVSAQIAISMLLLLVAGVTVHRMQRIVSLDPGFATNGIVFLSVSPSIRGYSEEQGQRFYDEVLKRVESVPGVQSASLAATVPPNDFSSRIGLFHEGQAPARDYLAGHEFELGLRVDMNNVAPGYFRTMGIPILQGRDFSAQDKSGSPVVAIVSRKLAERFWPGESAVGKRFEWPSVAGDARPPIEVVGVAADAKYRSLIADPQLLMYLPEFQNYGATENLVVRTAAEPAAALPEIRRAIAAVDKNMPTFGEKAISEQIADSLWQQRMASALLGSFSFLAVVIAAVGLYAVVAYWVGQRRQEIGVRMALGARPRDVLRLVVMHGAKLALIGIAIGTAVSLGVSGTVSSFLFGTQSTDVAATIFIASLLSTVAILASYLPARRAMRMDPVSALRHE